MNFIKKIFGGTSEAKERNVLPWIALTTLEQLDRIEEKSEENPQLIFKHSTRCGISRMVLGQFENDFDVQNDSMDIYFLDLLNHRDISNEIANKFDVIHESPQVLIVKNGKVVTHASHESINGLELKRF